MYYTLERLKKSRVLKTCATSATEPKFNYLMIQIQNCAMYIKQRVYQNIISLKVKLFKVVSTLLSCNIRNNAVDGTGIGHRVYPPTLEWHRV